MRRQGSGTYVGRATGDEPRRGPREAHLLQRARTPARRQARAGRARAREPPLGPEPGELFGLDPDCRGHTITRVLLMDGRPGAWMRDVVHPEIRAARRVRACASARARRDGARRAARARASRSPTRARTSPRACSRSATASARRSAWTRPIAALEIDHVTSTAEGAPVDALDRRLPPALHRPARDALARGPAAGARDRPDSRA